MAKVEQNQDLVRKLLRQRGALSALEITSALKLKQPTFSRLVSQMTDILTIGSGRSRVYALPRSPEPLPILKIDENSRAVNLGGLHPLLPKGALFFPNEDSKLKPQFFSDIPFFVWDIRPQGFLGKIFGRQNTALKLPDRWEDWKEDDLYRTLSQRGDDLVGNLIIGRESFERYQTEGGKTYSHGQRNKIYPQLALESLKGTFVGSSAGGEQPKFTALIQNGKKFHHVLVKFSPAAKSEAGQRWADLLIAEHTALSLLNENGFLAVKTEILECGDQVFLEVERFDRVGIGGRRGILSLGSIDDEFVGQRNSWTQTGKKLFDQKQISKRDFESITHLDCFGALIANTDRHFGNLSLYWDFGQKNFSLAPIYDMLPMLYAPIQGNLVTRDFKVPIAEIEQIPHWQAAKKLALEFWSRLSQDKTISSEFQKIAKANLKIVSG